MSLNTRNLNKNLIREIIFIVVIKIILLMTIKHIWFDAPTIPKNFDNQAAEHIAGTPLPNKETR